VLKLLRISELTELQQKGELAKPFIKVFNIDDFSWKMRVKSKCGNKLYGIKTNIDARPYYKEKVYYSFDTMDLVLAYFYNDFE